MTMFVTAIEHVAQFVRPIHFITRNYDSNVVKPGAATLFFVNADGWAFTCGHVADEIITAGQVNDRYKSFRTELASLKDPNRRARRDLAKRFGYASKVTCQVQVRLVGCGFGLVNINVRRHKLYDIALLQLTPAPKLQVLASFGKNGDDIKQGKYLCRMGFPFPEFTNFQFDAASDNIEWTQTGEENTPRFPLEGMITRHLLDSGVIVGFEMSTPGLRGQSGGPAFDVNGTIWGMQFQTAHLDLNFDVDQEVLRNGTLERRRDSAFLHVGHCFHVEILKQFMRAEGVAFAEA